MAARADAVACAAAVHGAAADVLSRALRSIQVRL
jgi:hypothetical protein